MESMISAIVTVEELLGAGEKKIGFLRNTRSKRREEYELPEDRIFNIPGYQREIRWDTNNIQVLVDDILEEPKFLGIILVSSADNTVFNIIDGQQRLTAILMLINAINKRLTAEKIKTVEFTNESFENIKEAIEKDFYENDEAKRNVCIMKDTLNQFAVLQRLWTYSSQTVNAMGDERFNRLKENLLECDLNLLIQPIRDKKDQKRVCVDYFIDINNKNVSLDYIDILKAYAFKENFEKINAQWITIQKKIKDTLNLFNYPMEAMFLHYILCVVNHSLNYGIKALSDDLKLTKKTEINGVIYENGTDIEILIEDKKFYSKMLTVIDKFIEFMKVILNDKSSYGTDFEQYVNPVDEVMNDEFKQNMFVIINGIIRSSDVVPKLLLMKYFVEIVNNDKATKNDYKLIYPIGVLATFFSAGKGNLKKRNEFSTLVLGKNWKNLLDKKAKNRIEKSNLKVVFGKEVKYKGTYTEWSGQFLARRVHAIFYSVEYKDKLAYHPDVFRAFNEANEYNDEHFIINQSYKIDFRFGNKNEEYLYPEVIKPIVSHLGNYLFILKKVNTKLGNKTVKDKIFIIEKYLAQGEEVFLDKLSEIKYEVAKDVFGNSECPAQENIKQSKSRSKAQEILAEYYEQKFINDYRVYIEKLSARLLECDLLTNPFMHKKKK